MKYKLYSISLLIIVSLFGCKKQPGEGGFASIAGKVYVKNYDAAFVSISSEYYLPSETVYIIYGDGNEIGNTVKTSYDGSFKFNYLRKGKYKIYVLGKDETQPNKSIPKTVLKAVTISQKKQAIVLEDLVIIK